MVERVWHLPNLVTGTMMTTRTKRNMSVGGATYMCTTKGMRMNVRASAGAAMSGAA